jgi:hypothetical protein
MRLKRDNFGTEVLSSSGFFSISSGGEASATLSGAGRSRSCGLGDGEDEGTFILGTLILSLEPSPLALKLKFLHLS